MRFSCINNRTYEEFQLYGPNHVRILGYYIDHLGNCLCCTGEGEGYDETGCIPSQSCLEYLSNGGLTSNKPYIKFPYQITFKNAGSAIGPPTANNRLKLPSRPGSYEADPDALLYSTFTVLDASSSIDPSQLGGSTSTPWKIEMDISWNPINGMPLIPWDIVGGSPAYHLVDGKFTFQEHYCGNDVNVPNDISVPYPPYYTLTVNDSPNKAGVQPFTIIDQSIYSNPGTNREYLRLELQVLQEVPDTQWGFIGSDQTSDTLRKAYGFAIESVLPGIDNPIKIEYKKLP